MEMNPEDVLNLRPSFFMAFELATGKLPSERLTFRNCQERIGLFDLSKVSVDESPSLASKAVPEARVIEIGMRIDPLKGPGLVGVRGIRIYIADGFPVTRARIREEIGTWFHELMENFPDETD